MQWWKIWYEWGVLLATCLALAMGARSFFPFPPHTHPLPSNKEVLRCRTSGSHCLSNTCTLQGALVGERWSRYLGKGQKRVLMFMLQVACMISAWRWPCFWASRQCCSWTRPTPSTSRGTGESPLKLFRFWQRCDEAVFATYKQGQINEVAFLLCLHVHSKESKYCNLASQICSLIFKRAPVKPRLYWTSPQRQSRRITRPNSRLSEVKQTDWPHRPSQDCLHTSLLCMSIIPLSCPIKGHLRPSDLEYNRIW